MPISEGYGQRGNDWYVNSAQGWSLDKLDDCFPEMDERGSVPLGYIETLVGSADLVGKWAIHSYIIEATGVFRAECPGNHARVPPADRPRGAVHVESFARRTPRRARCGDPRGAATAGGTSEREWSLDVVPLYGPD